MVFSDPKFLFVFLPIALIAFHASRKVLGGTASILVLVLLSCAFYAYWSVPYLLLLLAQIGVNYVFARAIERKPGSYLLTAAVAFNLLLLGYFKYRNFFLENVSAVTGLHFALAPLLVPLAISFHTFQQIALLVDVDDGEVHVPPILNYFFFVVFFPQLIAGPIVLHREMGRQVEAARAGKARGFAWFGPGVFLFIFGLFKKVCLADVIGAQVNIGFYPNLPLTMFEAWCAAIGYALQIYFDFSGYSDMAVGLGLLFGFKLPNNFLVPFRSLNMIDYWKRWHITMTRFFTMYTYMPLALRMARFSQKKLLGKASRFVLVTGLSTLVTFFLSGLWHGAGWTFIAFGLVNGLALIINHAWRDLKAPAVPAPVAWILTATVVLVQFVFFRSVNLKQAYYILSKMFVPSGTFGFPPWLAGFFHQLNLPIIAHEWFFDPATTIAVIGGIVVMGPLSVLLPALSEKPEMFKPSPLKAVCLAGMTWLVLGFLDEPHSFLYFAF